MGKDTKIKICAAVPRRKRAVKAVPPSNLSLLALQQLQELGKKANLNSGQTRCNYSGYIKRGRQWLAGHFSGDSNMGAPKGFKEDELPSLRNDMYQDPDFQNAFNDKPNQYMHHALALFISFKCFHQNMKAGTRTSIHAADEPANSLTADFCNFCIFSYSLGRV